MVRMAESSVSSREDFMAVDPLPYSFAGKRPNRDRGAPRGSSPPTPPSIRVRTRRFGRLCDIGRSKGSGADGCEERIWQGNGERGAVADPPRAVHAAGGLCRQMVPDTSTTQL